ncbi:hypothetical protein AB0J71_47765 [Nonomuraea sp. NPDC049637]|uniref:hypothetical protein n=1 Tax=Nonomuraea sp. NPDC049637 TaxID=3154356 RepID=UPI003445C037
MLNVVHLTMVLLVGVAAACHLLGWPLWGALLLAAAIHDEVLQLSSSSPRCSRSPPSGCTASVVSTH